MVWLSGWAKKIKFTLDNTKVYEDLTDFPVMLKLTSEHNDLFTTVGNNYNNILLMDSVSNDILYTEVVYWNSTEQLATLWVKIPRISYLETNYLYLFYDVSQSNTKYIGTIGTLAAMQVWTNNYTSVYHMGQTIDTPFTATTLYAGEISGTSGTGGWLVAATTFTSKNCTGLTKNNGALSIWIKVNNTDFLDIKTGNQAQIELSSSTSYDVQEWNLSLFNVINSNTVQYFIRNVSTTYKKFILPLSEFSTTGGELNVTSIVRIRLYAQASTTSVLTLYWKNAEIIYYPGGILDSVNTNHGNPLGSMSSSNLTDGLNSKATVFNGSSNYINCGLNENSSITGALTIETIVKQATIPSLQNTGIVSKYLNMTGYTNQLQFGLVSQLNTGKAVIQVSSNGTSATTLESSSVIGNTFTYITGIFNPSTEIAIFINGLKENSNTNSIAGSLYNGTAPTLIGTQYDTTNSELFFNGVIDEVLISKIVRSDSWIKTFNDNVRNNLISTFSMGVLSSGVLAYDNRIKLTIPYGYIDNTIYNFPILIKISKQSGFNTVDISDIFDSLESSYNHKKIAITDYTGVGQCFCEIESWDHSEKQAYLWANVPKISSIEDTILYIYYDKIADNNNFIGTTNSYIGDKVWNSNFFAVYHLSTNPKPLMYDSTENKINLTPSTNLTEIYLEKAEVGTSLYFNSYEKTTTTKRYTYYPVNTFSFECVCKVTVTHEIDTESNSGTTGTSGQNYMLYVGEWYDSTVSMACALLSVGTNGISVYEYCNGYMPPVAVYNGTVGTNYNHIFVVYNARTPSIYLNGVKVRTGLVSGKNTVFANLVVSNNSSYPSKGSIHKFRIYNTGMSDAWIKASYYNNFDKLIIYTPPDKTSEWLETYESGNLSPWAKRIPINISAVNSPLVDLPLLLNITEDSGITNFNCTDLFTTLDYTIDGTFTGIDGNMPDSNIWFYVNTTKSTAYLNNDTLFLSISNPTAGEYAYFKSNFYLKGDFDIQIMFLNVTNTTDKDTGLELYLCNNTNTYAIYTKVVYDSGNKFASEYKVGGSFSGYITTNRVNNYGSIRYIRTGSSVQVLYKDGDAPDWTTFRTVTLNSDDYAIRLAQWCPTGASTSCNVDNFIVNSGIILWPSDKFPNRKKIALTSEDGITLLPVEIERWDHVSKSIQLWAKIPLVKSNEITKLYLYYDVNKSANTTYVGNIGESMSCNVWSNNFAAVYHLSQDPSTTVKDSTTNARNLTTYGSMTVAGNIIDSDVGKATYFDGVDDYMQAAASNLSALQTEFTVDSVCKWTSMSSYSKIIHIGAESTGAINLDRSSTTSYVDCGIWGDATQSNTSISVTNFKHYGLLLNVGVVKTIGNSVIDTITNSVTVQSLSTAMLTVGGTSVNYRYQLTIRSIRVATVARSAAWLNAAYLSDFDILLSFNSVENYVPAGTYLYKGYVKEKGVPVVRTVALYERSTGLQVDTTVSNSDGSYTLETVSNSEHFIVALDDDEGIQYDSLIKDRLLHNS